MKEPIYSYGPWRQRLLKVCIIISVIVFLTEFLILFLDKWAGLLFLPLPLYIFRFLLLPSFINFSSVFICSKLLQSGKLQERTKNFVSAILLFVLCACSELAHYVFAPIFCAPCIAIFVSAIFEDKKITRTIFSLSLVSLSMASIIAALELRRGDRQLLLDWLVALVITICIYLVTKFLADFECERTRSIASSYKKQFELTEQLKHDHLTGLLNRKAFFELLDHYINKQPEKGLYLAVIDVDDYKNVNDTYGHIQGDAVLKYLAEILEKYVLQHGFIARYGGDEFAVVFMDIPASQACEIIEKVRNEFNSHRFDFQKDLSVTFTCGLASHRGQRSQEFFETADRALYQAKAQGKNCTVCITDAVGDLM